MGNLLCLLRSTKSMVPNTNEVDGMVGLMNRQMPAFIKHYLLYRRLPKEVVIRLVVASCCPTLVGK